MKTLAAFLLALQMMESEGNHRSVNTLGYLGLYQFGEAALTDLGMVRFDGDAYDNNYSGGWTGKFGVWSTDGFLSSPRAQEKAMAEWLGLMWSYIELQNVDSAAWTEVDGERLTPSGMLAGARLLGADSLAIYVRSDGEIDPRDPYGTPISAYVSMLNGYSVPYGPPDPGASDSR